MNLLHRLDDETEEKPQSEPNAFLEEALFKARYDDLYPDA